jgi:hypothetical protein
MRTFAEYAVEESIFEEYLNQTDEEQLLEDALISENIFDYLKNPALSAAGALDAGISGVGGTGKQILRGAGNIAGGLGRTGLGLGTSVLGPSGTRKWGREQIGGGLKQVGKGLGQAALSPISGLIRAKQAAGDPFGELPIGGSMGKALGIARDKDIDDYLADLRVGGRRPQLEPEAPPVDDVTVAQTAGDLRKLIGMWKTAKTKARLTHRLLPIPVAAGAQAMGGEDEEMASAIRRVREIQRAMKRLAPEWYTAQIAKGKAARAKND